MYRANNYRLLLSFDENLIDDEEFIFLNEMNSSKNPDLSSLLTFGERGKLKKVIEKGVFFFLPRVILKHVYCILIKNLVAFLVSLREIMKK